MHVHGEQLLLDLRYSELPWNGRSPRDLTKGAILFSLPHVGATPPTLALDQAVQLKLFPQENPS